MPLRGQNNVQGGGDMGAIPAKLPGGYDVGDEDARARFAAVWGTDDYPREPGMHLSQMFEAMERGSSRRCTASGRTRPSPRPTPRTPGTCSRAWTP